MEIQLNHYRMVVRTTTLSNDIFFCDLPRSTISKLKELHYQVFQRVNLGRLLVFLKFVLEEQELEKFHHMP